MKTKNKKLRKGSHVRVINSDRVRRALKAVWLYDSDINRILGQTGVITQLSYYTFSGKNEYRRVGECYRASKVEFPHLAGGRAIPNFCLVKI